MGCGDKCPFAPLLRRDDWPLPDPKGKGIEQVRQIRDEIERRVKELIGAERVGRQARLLVRLLSEIAHNRKADWKMCLIISPIPTRSTISTFLKSITSRLC